MNTQSAARRGDMSQRVKVVPCRAANGLIQGWAINVGVWELGFYTGRTKALNMANLYARELARELTERRVISSQRRMT